MLCFDGKQTSFMVRAFDRAVMADACGFGDSLEARRARPDQSSGHRTNQGRSGRQPSVWCRVLGVLGISHDFEEAEIAVDAADVLRRSGASGVDTCGNPRLRLKGQPTFEFDHVLPAVAEVVLIHEVDWFPMAEVEQPYLGFVEASGIPLGPITTGAATRLMMPIGGTSEWNTTACISIAASA